MIRFADGDVLRVREEGIAVIVIHGITFECDDWSVDYYYSQYYYSAEYYYYSYHEDAGPCVDAEDTGLTLWDGRISYPATCEDLRREGFCTDRDWGATVTELCPASCGECSASDCEDVEETGYKI